MKIDLKNSAKRVFLLVAMMVMAGVARADEVTILLGPKTIGAGWKDNIVVEARHFSQVKAGDVMTVYTDEAKRTAQGAFQDPKDWQAISPEYAYFGINGPVRMVIGEGLLPVLKERGVAIGGHDYRILRVTLTPAEEFEETTVWKGPAVQMKADWSVSAELPGKCFKDLQVGDGLRLYVSRVQEGAAAKLMDFTWNALEPAVDGAGVGEESFTYYINDDAPLLKLRLAGTGDNVAMRVGGKNYRLDRVAIVRFTGQRSEDFSQAQRAPKEYKLEPGELFHGEKTFPNDWSGNLRLTAEPFQDCTENDVVVISYGLLDGIAGEQASSSAAEPAASEGAQMSFRENKGKWHDITGQEEPVWYALDGNDVVLTFDAVSLDKVKTNGLVVTGKGFVLKRIELISAQ
ncbi:MAG: hypothetical protein IJ196_02100 [Prevotella sp.]|nr:hypothetical protein [Prevotella sp.]